MDSLIILLLFALILSPLILIIIGFIVSWRPGELARKRSKTLYLAGVIALGVEILVGYAVCSSMG